MMKIGCGTFSFDRNFKDGFMTLESFIDEAYRMRLDGVELTSYQLQNLDRRYLYGLKRLCLERGLSISMVSSFVCIWQLEEDKKKAQIQEAEKWVDIACDLGAPCLRIHGGRWREENFTADDIESAVQVGKKISGYGEEKGVVIALENDQGITRFADDVIKIVKGVGSEWFKVNLDTGNYFDYCYEDIEKSAAYTVHVHAKPTTWNSPKRQSRVPVDYQRVRAVLESVGYNGWISIDYSRLDPEDPRTAVPKFAKQLFNIFG